MISRRRHAFAVALATAVAAVCLAVPAVSAAAPAVEVQVTPLPGTFHRGEESEFIFHEQDRFAVTMKNIGDTPINSEALVLTNEPGAPLISSRSNPGGASCIGDGPIPTETHGAKIITCPTPFGYGEIEPGESRSATPIAVLVPEDAPDTVTTKVTVSGGGIPLVTATGSAPVADGNPFDLEYFSSGVYDEAGDDYTVAGGHGWQNTTAFGVFRDDAEYPIELMKDSVVDLPLGLIGNPSAAPRCPIAAVPFFEFIPGLNCPKGSKVGEVFVGGTPAAPQLNASPLYNVKPDAGHPAQFAFNFVGTIVALQVVTRPRSEGYGLSVVTPDIGRLAGSAGFSVGSVKAVFYGVPFEHTGVGTEAPFLSNSVDCGPSNSEWAVRIDSWEHAGLKESNGYSLVPDLSDPNWKSETLPAAPIAGCDNPALAELFKATAAIRSVQPNPGVQADQPSGLAVDLDLPQANDPTDPSNTTFDPTTPQTPEFKTVTTKLPAGLSISPSSADGLVGCSDQAGDPAGDQVHYDAIAPVTCPSGSRIGTATADTPLLALHDPVTDEIVGPQPLEGGVYLISPHAGDLSNGQDGKFRLLLDLESARYGVNIKLPGVAVADKQTGQLTATFDQNPQLPASHVRVEFKSGPRAPLATPVTCGTQTMDANFVPWGSPEIPSVDDDASFNVDSGANGAPCATSPGQRPFAPALAAGTESTKAGASSPFNLKVSRSDGDQNLTTIDVTTPPGFTAKLAGVGTCSDAAIATAAAKSGSEERANPSCPADSRVGSVTAGAGPGTNPFYTTGNAYLAGPYKGAPLSFVFVTPAVAGPFDLGDVVVRAAVTLNSSTTQVTVKTDPLPQILDGVPLRLRSIAAHLDRSNFTLNPTDCNAMSVSASVNGSDGATANPTQPFQVDDCTTLGFKPTLKLALKGSVKRRGHPSLKATLNARPGDANFASAQVKLPKSAFLDNAHIGEVCTRVQFAAHSCPAGSIYGKATATTPLLGYTLAGPVYLRSSSHQLPDLVVAFQGPASQPIEIELAGKTDSVKGALRNTFEAVPDVPVSTFQLELFGGKKGLVVMSAGFCASPKATVNFTGQNGMESKSTPKVAAKCPKVKKKHAGGKH